MEYNKVNLQGYEYTSLALAESARDLVNGEFVTDEASTTEFAPIVKCDQFNKWFIVYQPYMDGLLGAPNEIEFYQIKQEIKRPIEL